MKPDPKLILSQEDFDKLTALLAGADTTTASLLADELLRASVVDAQQRPPDVVAMNCKVQFLDLETKKTSEVTVVYPHEADIDQQKISVLTPIGSALIGLRTGMSIKWPLPNGKQRSLKVTSVQQNVL